MRIQTRRRRGTMAEGAVVTLTLVMLLLGLVIVGLGVFRFQQVAALARECTRYASVHGAQYKAETGNAAAATSTDIYNKVVVPRAVGLSLSNVTCTATWTTSNNPYHTTIVNGAVVAVANTVKVTISYQWVPEAFLGGISLTSTSETIMSY